MCLCAVVCCVFCALLQPSHLCPSRGPGPPAEGPGAARTVRANADRRRRGARGGGAARTVRATAAAAVGPGGRGASAESP